MTVLDDIGRARYVSLVTYRKSGVEVATPVWHAVDGDQIYVVSDADAGKVKRIRNGGRVAVTVCDFRGRIAPGAPTAEGWARLLDEAGTATARELVARKYVLSRWGNRLVRLLHLPKRPVIGIAVTI